MSYKNSEETIKFLSQKELKRLFLAIRNSEAYNKYWFRDYCIFRIAYRCALRASEVGLIYVQDYNRQRGEIYCRRLKGSNNNTLRLEKSEIKDLNKYIKMYNLQDDDVLFQSQFKKPISRKTLNILMKKYCHEAKIADKSKWHFHTLRHSIAVHLAESSLDIKELQYYLGHKNVNNTMVYFYFTTAQHEAMYNKIKSNNKTVTF